MVLPKTLYENIGLAKAYMGLKNYRSNAPIEIEIPNNTNTRF